MKLGDLNRRITFERKAAPEAEASDDAGAEVWEPAVSVWAQVQGVLPSRAEKVAEGITSDRKPARVRTRYRTDITGDMRIVFGTRILQIISGPVEVGDKDWLEMMAEETISPGNPA